MSTKLSDFGIKDCWRCQRRRVCTAEINITIDAASSSPSNYKPICSDCSATLFGQLLNQINYKEQNVQQPTV
jgi:hypothetical protein